MKMFTVLSLLLFALLVTDMMASSAKTPKNVKPCKDSEDLSQCVINAWEYLRPDVGKGIPMFKIPQLDPLPITKMPLSKKTDSIDLKAIMTQLTVKGMSKLILSGVNVNLTDLSGSANLMFANLDVTTLYALDATLMKIVAMKGRGNCKGTISNVKMYVKGKAVLSPKDEDGDSYLKFTELKLKIFIGDAKARLVDTSNVLKNQMFTKTVNKYYDNNKREVLDIISPLIETYCHPYALKLVNDVLSTVPFESMLSASRDPRKP